MNTGNSARCNDGIVFPAFEGEENWNVVLRGSLYLVGLMYVFLGVAIIADMFMAAIEKVTSKRWQKNINGRTETRKVWNDTVATLSLMALGSSAPEIFLSIIDVVKKRFHFGKLGPSTIVGSASFNLFCIIAACVVAIPSGETRLINNLPAFYITAAFSILAYMWMAFILIQSSKNVVEIWEAAVTLGFLPLLIWVSYKVDKGDANWIIEKILKREAHENAETPGALRTLIKFEDHLHIWDSFDAKTAPVKVLRTGPTHGFASVAYKTLALSAVPGFDYQEIEGVIEFGAGESVKYLMIEINKRKVWRANCSFVLILEDLEGEANFDEEDDGGSESAIMTIKLNGTPWKSVEKNVLLSSLDKYVGLEMLRAGFEDWGAQIKGAFFCGGSVEEHREASFKELICHFIALPWKLVFSAVPPTVFFGGWLSFFLSLLGIAGLTAAVSDLAELFGCVLGVPDIVTAITFVALGTSMPDLFASLSSATEDENADASIVNVTGSNSVNVFLGLGVPWSIAAIYWKVTGYTPDWLSMYSEYEGKYNGAVFVIEAPNLGFCVVSFSFLSVAALTILHFRRKWLGAELGGPVRSKWLTGIVFVGYWFGWAGVVSHRVLRWSTDRTMETMAVQAGGVMATFGAFTLLMVVMRCDRRNLLQEQEKSDQIAAKIIEDECGVVFTCKHGPTEISV